MATTIKDKTCIKQEVYKKVHERDERNGWCCCIFCGRPAWDEEGHGLECHHYIPRSKGGMGIEENLVFLCSACHREVHNGNEFINEFIKEYLFLRYKDWNEEKLKWRKDNG